MFTGLIERIGIVQEVRKSSASGILTVSASFPDEPFVLGESIAVNGACLTVTSFSGENFTVDVSPETFDCTNIGELQSGSPVNLERALRLNDRLGGHLVSGHIDAVATLIERRKDANAIRLTFRLDEKFLRFLVEKGSVTIDGISLTVNSVGKDSFSVAIIPHSLEKTTLNGMKVGRRVNIETDLIAKYVWSLLSGGGGASSSPRPALDLDFLAKHGFL